MKIKWYGHACFMLENRAGQRLLTDPCDPQTGYDLKDIPADIVTISHDHHDHNYIEAVAGDPEIVRSAGKHKIGDVRIEGFGTWHDEQQGALRGENIVFVIEMDGMRIAHMGDIGHMPDEHTCKQIGKVDVLLVPIGGTYTIDQTVAREIADALRPSVMIPMHYRTPQLAFELEGVQPLLNAVKSRKVHKLNQSECTLNFDSLGEERLLVLDCG